MSRRGKRKAMLRWIEERGTGRAASHNARFRLQRSTNTFPGKVSPRTRVGKECARAPREKSGHLGTVAADTPARRRGAYSHLRRAVRSGRPPMAARGSHWLGTSVENCIVGRQDRRLSHFPGTPAQTRSAAAAASLFDLTKRTASCARYIRRCFIKWRSSNGAGGYHDRL